MKRLRLLALTLFVAALAAGAVSAASKKESKQASAKAAATAGARAAGDSDAVLVRIGSEVITPRMLAARVLELPEQYRAQYSTPDGRKQILDRLVEEKVWMKDADANGVTRRPELLVQIEAQKRDLLIRTWGNEV